MLQIPLSFWCSPLHLISITLLSVLGEGSLTCGSLRILRSFYPVKSFFSSFSLLLLRVKGRRCHTLLKPCETNCDLWIRAIPIQFDWLKKLQVKNYKQIPSWIIVVISKNSLGDYVVTGSPDCRFVDFVSWISPINALLLTFIWKIPYSAH